MKVLICLLIGAISAGAQGVQPQIADNAAPLPQRVYQEAREMPDALNAFDAVNSAAGKILSEALEAPGCAAVFGEDSATISAHFRQTQHFASPNSLVAAEETLAGTTSFAYAVTYADSGAHRVLLFPSFFSPASVARRRLNGDIDQVNTIPAFERSLGLVPGSLTADLFEAIVLGHEQTHANGSGIEDLQCLGLSSLNTLRIIKNCFPALLDPAPSEPRIVAWGYLIVPPESCGQCHADRKGQRVIMQHPRLKAVGSTNGQGTIPHPLKKSMPTTNGRGTTMPRPLLKPTPTADGRGTMPRQPLKTTSSAKGRGTVSRVQLKATASAKAEGAKSGL